MTAQRPSSLGECPHCGGELSGQDVLITYETADGTSLYAECPDCRDVVSPI